MPRRIVSIASAPGWAARFDTDSGGERVVTLLAWALVEDDGEQSLVGFVQRSATAEHPNGRNELADEVEGFAGYVAGALQTKRVTDS